jgi:hypothetical protein
MRLPVGGTYSLVPTAPQCEDARGPDQRHAHAAAAHVRPRR